MSEFNVSVPTLLRGELIAEVPANLDADDRVVAITARSEAGGEVGQHDLFSSFSAHDTKRKLTFEQLMEDESALLTEEHLRAFSEDGVVVVDDVLSRGEVSEILSGFHDYLLSVGVDHSDLEGTGGNLAGLSSTGGAGGILDIFWAEFKLKVAEHPRIVATISKLMAATFASSDSTADGGVWSHPYGKFDASRPLMAVDRVCYRLPDALSSRLGGEHGDDRIRTGAGSSGSSSRPLQRHLAPHLDCCPPHRAEEVGTDLLPAGAKWRPIQAFVSLTDCLETNRGGFECCKGLHRNFEAWGTQQRPWGTKTVRAKKKKKQQHKKEEEEDDDDKNTKDKVEHDLHANEPEPELEQVAPPCIGAFTPMRPKEDAAILARLEHVACRAGSLVLWDNRLPHANSRSHGGRQEEEEEEEEVRQVVYISVLPRVPRNEQYCRDQLRRYEEGRLPSDFWQAQGAEVRQRCAYGFSALGRDLMGMEEEGGDGEALID